MQHQAVSQGDEKIHLPQYESPRLSIEHTYMSHSHSNLCLSHPMGFPLSYYNINIEYNSIKIIKFMKV